MENNNRFFIVSWTKNIDGIIFFGNNSIITEENKFFSYSEVCKLVSKGNIIIKNAIELTEKQYNKYLEDMKTYDDVMLEKFRRFLKRNGTSVSKVRKYCKEENGFSEFEFNFHFSDWCCDTFEWAKTEEGFDFWNDMDMYWMEYLKEM